MKLVEQIQEYCRDRNAKCPHCGKKISMKQRTVFLLRGTAHYINCEHCGGAMHPAREAIPFVYCFGGGFFIAYAFPTFYIYFIEDNIWHAILFMLPWFIMLLLIICILTYRRIEFSI